MKSCLLTNNQNFSLLAPRNSCLRNMKNLILLCLVSSISLQAFAQQNEIDTRLKVIKLEDAIQKKKAGRTLTAVGGGLLAVGLIVGLNSSETTTYTSGGPTQTSSTGNLELETLSFALGVGCMGIGIPVWSVGAHREKKLRNEGATLSLTPHVNGLTLRLRF